MRKRRAALCAARAITPNIMGIFISSAGRAPARGPIQSVRMIPSKQPQNKSVTTECKRNNDLRQSTCRRIATRSGLGCW